MLRRSRPDVERTVRATISSSDRVTLGSMDDLATCLRQWRDRLDPAEVGVRADGYRRAPGLRREELARLAGLSVDYLARLEQGRATNPSPQVLDALSRALQLCTEERGHLFRLAGHTPPGSGQIDRHLTPGVQRILARLTDVPVTVVDATWQVIAVNELASALLDNAPRAGHQGNYAWLTFSGEASRIQHSDEDWARQRQEIVADLRDAVGRYPNDAPLRALIDDLHARSPEFTALWEQAPVRPRAASQKTVLHPEVGPITVDCDILTVCDSDVRLIVYTVPPGSAAEQALQLVGVLGHQRVAPVDAR